MSYSSPNQRVGIFVDAQNIYHSAKNLYRARVNFKELLRVLVGERELIRAFAYVVKSDPATGEDSFFEALKQSGFDLRTKDLQVFADGSKKGDWDVGIAVDAVRMAPSLDIVILVTGDGDFVPLIDYLKWGMGKEVHVAAFSRTASAKLRDAADAFIEIEKTPRALLKINPMRSQNTQSRTASRNSRRRG